MEMIGAALYSGFAKQYRSDEKLREKFLRFSEQEAMHGRLFSQFYRNRYGKGIRGKFFWTGIGRSAAFVMRPFSLQKKLKKVSAAEQEAVKSIEEILACGEENGFLKIMKIILPDEREHAALYGELFQQQETLFRER